MNSFVRHLAKNTSAFSPTKTLRTAFIFDEEAVAFKNTGIHAAMRAGRELIDRCDYHFRIETPKLEIDFWFVSRKEDMLLLWNVGKLGERYPGGYYSLLDPTLEIVHEGSGDTVLVPLLPSTSHSHYARMTGKKGYFRVRGNRQPKILLTRHFGLKKGTYGVHFMYGLQNVKGLKTYTPGYGYRVKDSQIYLGLITIKKDLPCSNEYPINELHYLKVDHKRIRTQFSAIDVLALPLSSSPRDSSAGQIHRATNVLNPEHYFEEHLLGIAKNIIQGGYKAFFPPCKPENVVDESKGVIIQGERIFGEFCGSLALAFRLTGKAEYYFASRIAYEMVESNVWKTKWGTALGIETLREGDNLLELGLCVLGIHEFYKVNCESRILTKSFRMIQRWPYHRKYHIPYIEVHQDGKEIHPSFPFNMIAVGCAAMWSAAKALGDRTLQRRVKDTLHYFLLPMMEADGHWDYAYHYEEKKKRPEPAGYHYDLFTKMNLSRLLEDHEWQDDDVFLEAITRGIDFSLRNCTVEKENMLIWSDQYTEERGPHFAINHAGLIVSLLALMAKYADKKYLKPLEQTIRFIYRERDRGDLPQSSDWKSGWLHSHVLTPLLKVRDYGFFMTGDTPGDLKVESKSVSTKKD